jgi:hypothetical protein
MMADRHIAKAMGVPADEANRLNNLENWNRMDMFSLESDNDQREVFYSTAHYDRSKKGCQRD